MRKALVDKTGRVVNIIEYDSKAKYAPPKGLTITTASTAAAIGGTYSAKAKRFTRPPERELEADPMEALQARVTALEKTVNKNVIGKAKA